MAGKVVHFNSLSFLKSITSVNSFELWIPWIECSLPPTNMILVLSKRIEQYPSQGRNPLFSRIWKLGPSLHFLFLLSQMYDLGTKAEKNHSILPRSYKHVSHVFIFRKILLLRGVNDFRNYWVDFRKFRAWAFTTTLKCSISTNLWRLFHKNSPW